MKSIRLSIAAIFNLAVLFLLQWLPVSKIGAGISTDLLFSALIVPQVIAAIFASNLLQVLIPVIVEEENSLTNGTFGGIAIIVAITFLTLYSILAYFTIEFTHIIYPAYTPSDQQKISWLIQISLIGSFFTIMVATLSAAFYAEKKSLHIELFGCISGLISIAFMVVLFSKDNIDIAIWSINLRWGLCFLLLFTFCSSKKISSNCSSAIKKILKRFKNLIFGSSIYKTDIIVDRYFSAQSATGDLTILHIIQQGFAALSALLNRVVLTPNSPLLAEHNKEKRNKEFQQLFVNILRKILFLNIICFTSLGLAYFINQLIPPITIGGTLISHWLNVALLSSGIILGGTFGGLFTVRYYSKGNTSTPTKVGLFGFIMACLMKIFAFKLFGFTGLLIAISAHYLLTSSTFYFLYLNDKKSQSTNFQ